MAIELSFFGVDGEKSVSEYLGGWNNSNFPSGLVQACNIYVQKPIKELDGEGLRVLISQRIGLEFVVPATICFLYTDPFSGGDYEEGALVRELLQVPEDLWTSKPLLKKYTQELVIFLKKSLGKLRVEDNSFDLDIEVIEENLLIGIKAFEIE